MPKSVPLLPATTYTTPKKQPTRLAGRMPYEMKVWVSGACRGNGRRNSVGGAGAWFESAVNGTQGHCRSLSSSPTPTKQRADLSAILLALELAAWRQNTLNKRPLFVLNLYSDSDYAVNCCTKFIHDWRQNGWKTVDGEPVWNKDLIQKIGDFIDAIAGAYGEVHFHPIPADQNTHAARAANQACDNAAKAQAAALETDTARHDDHQRVDYHHNATYGEQGRSHSQQTYAQNSERGWNVHGGRSLDRWPNDGYVDHRDGRTYAPRREPTQSHLRVRYEYY
ncbi:Ribonuclease H1 [Mycena kentingensis (nom. inval.)]|nr:Ribonuclease H1 [Mycena kentingensis (nom. inval.)]